jgi:protein-disulfide isomerase
MEPKPLNPLLTLPSAIIIAGTVIAIAIIWTHKPAASAVAAPSTTAPAAAAQASLPPVASSDHILGNPNAPIKIVEYSDPSCPYCKEYNPTMEQVMAAYGAGGQVAWIYRQFPLDQPDASGNVLHPNAGNQAEAFECAASLGGNTAFWTYEKEWFTVFPSDGADRSPADDAVQIAQVAKDSGLDAVAFSDCLSSAQFKSKIDAEYQGGLGAGVTGTPYTFIITPSGTDIPLPGVESYTTLKSTIDTLMTETGQATQ